MNTKMSWGQIFSKEYIRNLGATQEEIDIFSNTWNSDLSQKEIDEINARQKNPFRKGDKYYDLYKPHDPGLWYFPNLEFPQSFLNFLKYSNGGEFQNGDRYFQFFGTKDLREMNIIYELPEYMKNAVSFAMDGCGNHLLFDMREKRINNEYPVLAAHSGNLGYEDCKFIGHSFEEVCKGMTAIDEEMNPEDEYLKSFPQEVDIYLSKMPKSGKKGLLFLKQKLKLKLSMGELFDGLNTLPFKLLKCVMFSKYYKDCYEINSIEDCIDIYEADSNRTINLKEWIKP